MRIICRKTTPSLCCLKAAISGWLDTPTDYRSFLNRPAAAKVEILEPRRFLSASGNFGPWENVVLLDTRVPDAIVLRRAVLPGTKVFAYDGASASANMLLSELSQWAKQAGIRVSSLSILAHGDAGAFQLGDQWISVKSLSQTAAAWRTLGSVLAPSATVDLFNCDLAAPGGDGKRLVDQLSVLTGRAVFASTNLTGTGGDWNLEYGSNGQELQATNANAFPLNAAELQAYPADLSATPPTVATPAAASPNNVTGKTTNLSVLGADAAGQSTLTYTWATTGTVPEPVIFSVNGTNSAADTTATFTSAGSYHFQVTITNGAGLSVTSTVAVTVAQTLKTITVSPGTASLNEYQTQQFSAVGYDQFGNAMSTQPAWAWSVASGGVGSVNSTGLYTALGAAGPASITATSGSISGTASVVVNGGSSSDAYPPAQATVENVPLTFSSLNGNSLSAASGASGFELSVASGILTLPTTSGLTFTNGTANNRSTVACEGSVAALNSALNGLVFTPAANFTGSDPLTFTTGSTVFFIFTFNTTNTVPITVTAAAPTVAASAAANPSPAIGTTAALSVLGADDSGESNLTYSWVTTGTPPAPVVFSIDGTNAAKDTTATFSKPGDYSFKVTITNGSGLSVISSVNTSVNQTLTSIAVSPAQATLNENQSEQFAAVAYDQFGQPMADQPSFTWARASGVGNMNGSGLYTAPYGTGAATITATSGLIWGSAAISVTNAAPTVATAATATPGTVTGTSTALSVLGADDGGASNLTYTWATTGTPPASVTFSTNGTNAAKNCTAVFGEAGTYNFQVTITDAGGLSVTSSVTVVVSQTLTTIRVAPTPVTVAFNGTQQFSATAYDQFGAAMAEQPVFDWSLSSGVGSISTTGLYSAPASSGSATVSASTGSVAGSANLTVSNTPPTVATPASASNTTVTGTSTNLTVLGADGGGESGLTYTWSTTVMPVGAEPAFSVNGTNAAKASTVTFNKAGNYTFQVTIQNAGGATATSSVNVTVAQTLTSITTAPTSVGLNLNASKDFAATAYDQFNQPMSSQPAFTWTVASGVGSINTSNGMYDSGPSAGTAVVSATSGSVTGSSNVTVTNAAPTIVAAAAASPSPVSGTTTALSVLAADDGGEPNLTYNWITTGTLPAAVSFSINNNNAAQNTTATFTRSGTYSFLVTVTDAGGLTATSAVSVIVNQTVSTIVVSPGSVGLNENQNQQFTAVAYDQFGRLMQVQPAFAWARAAGIGSISASGLFTAPNAPGMASIAATSGLVSGAASVTVTNAAPTIASAAAAAPGQVTGTSSTLSVLGADDGGESNLVYTWSTIGTPPASVGFSDNATHSAKNTVATFSKAGDYELLATVTDAGGLSAVSSVNVVVNQTLTALALSPTSATVVERAAQQFNAVATDQFGNPMAVPTLNWAVASGAGSINGQGLFTAPGVGGTSMVSASSGNVSATATITIPAETPTVAVGASASPAVVTTTSTMLSVLGADNDGEANLTYIWSAMGTPPAPVRFSNNGNNSAKNVTVNFSAVGSYELLVTITNLQGLSVCSSVNVTVLPVASSMQIYPSVASVGRGQSAAFSATALDQFGAPLTVQPSVDWSVSGAGGSIDPTGLYSAPSAGNGSDAIVAISGNLTATATAGLVDDLSAMGPSILYTTSGTSAAFANGHAIVITDADPQTASVPVSVSIGATHGTVEISEMTGLTLLFGAVSQDTQLTFSGSVADVDKALRSMIYQPDTNFTGIGSVSVTLNETGNPGPSASCATQIEVSAPLAPAHTGGNEQTGSAVSTPIGSQTNADVLTSGSTTSDTNSDSTSTTANIAAPPATIITGGTGGGIVAPQTPAPHAPQTPAQPPAQTPAKPVDHSNDAQAAQQAGNPPANTAPANAATPNATGPNPLGTNHQIPVPDVLIQTVPEQVFKFLAPKGEMVKQMDEASKKLVSEKQIKIYAGSATVASFGASAAYLLWILRGGSLLSSLLTILPAWKTIDPLPVLDNFESRKRRKKRLKSDVESLESMVDKSNTESENLDRLDAGLETIT